MADDLEANARSRTDRCQERDGGKQCGLPIGHRCKHYFNSEPLTLLQALSWAEETRLVAAEAREEALGEAATKCLELRDKWVAKYKQDPDEYDDAGCSAVAAECIAERIRALAGRKERT